VGEERIVLIEDFIRETVVACVLRAFAGRRLVETENPSACAAVCCK
jgi:hypothetical protein